MHPVWYALIAAVAFVAMEGLAWLGHLGWQILHLGATGLVQHTFCQLGLGHGDIPFPCSD